MSVIRNRFAAAPFTVQALEAIQVGQHVIVGLRGPGFNGTPGDLETVGQIFNVFTLSDGKVVRWRDFLTRQEALAAVMPKTSSGSKTQHRAAVRTLSSRALIRQIVTTVIAACADAATRCRTL